MKSDCILKFMGQKGEHVTGLGNEARLEESGSKRKSGRETRVQAGDGAAMPESIALALCPEAGGRIGPLEALGQSRQTTPFVTVPAAKSSWTLITSNSLPWCIYFLILPNGKAVGV